MVMCLECRLVQLESDPTTPEEPRGLEPSALVEQAEAAINQAEAHGYVRPGIRVLEYPSPHGGSWVEQLGRRSLVEVSQGPAELLVDIFGMMHEADQRAALTKRISQMSADAILLMQFHTVAAIVEPASGTLCATGISRTTQPRSWYAWRQSLGSPQSRLGSTPSTAERSCWRSPGRGHAGGTSGRAWRVLSSARSLRGFSSPRSSSVAELLARELGRRPRKLSRGCQVAIRNGGRLQRRLSGIGLDALCSGHCPRPRRRG